MHSQPKHQLLDQSVFVVLDKSPFALSLRELSANLRQDESVILEALDRLVGAGRVKMTADRASRVYYTRVEHLQ